MNNIPATPTLIGDNLACRISNKFFAKRNEHQTQDYSWKIKSLEERVEYLEFTLREVLTMLDEKQRSKNNE